MDEETVEFANENKGLLWGIIAWEMGELDEEAEVTLFQHLIDTGMAWQLQGSYGRRAKQFIENGTCSLPERKYSHGIQ